ncbi:hypothetical protein M0R36_04375 [bacterium]|jgi:hypothetical protein|nr:hypothetical protein [bacterium]
MLKKLIDTLRSQFRTQNPVNPLIFKDPLAEKTEWTPLKGGGANFCTHKLVEVEPFRYEFRASVGAKIFYALFFLIGMGVFIGFTAGFIIKRSFPFGVETILPLVIGLIFAAVGATMLYFGTAPIVFDRQTGYFWKGRKDPMKFFDSEPKKWFASLEDIHAFQIISEYCRSDKSSYYSYELNIVLKDGSRINVVDHGNLKRLKEDTAKLSAFLGKPVWEAV